MSMYVFSTIYRVFDSARKEINTQPVEPAAREKRGRRNVLHGLGFYVCVCVGIWVKCHKEANNKNLIQTRAAHTMCSGPVSENRFG